MADGKYWISDYLLNKEEDLYVLCSHSHLDHFNPDILTWMNIKKNIRYIFSRELLESGKAKEGDAQFLIKEEVFRDHRIKLKAFGSTDAGSSFLLSYNGKLFFHAGDLNNWHWNEEVGFDEALGYENLYLCELELISEKSDNLHVVMFPLDPRLGKDFMRGAEQFVSRIKTDYFFPMHFGDNFDKVNQFEAIASKYGTKFLSVSKRGQTFRL